MSKQPKMPKPIKIEGWLRKFNGEAWIDLDGDLWINGGSASGSLPNLHALHAWLGKVIAAKEGAK